MLDPYSAYVLNILRSEHGLPLLADDPLIRTLPMPERPSNRAATNFACGEAYQRRHLQIEKLSANPARYAVVWREWFLDKLFGDQMPAGTIRFYGYWQGYRKQPTGLATERALEAAGAMTRSAHVGGHINAAALKELLNRLNPKRIIPIHTRAAGVLQTEFPNCVVINNGEHIDL